MLRVAVTVRADAVEEVLDGLLPLLPQGVHPSEVVDGAVELAVYGTREALPARAAVERLAGDALLHYDEQDAPDDPRERRRAFGRTWAIGGRLAVRPSDAPAGRSGLPELVIDSPAGAFGTGAHTTTRMCLELLLDLEPGGGFADLGCGAGVLAIAAATLGWAPVVAVDNEPRSVEAAARNAERNGVAVEARELDLTAQPPPPARTVAANVPPEIHARIAAALPPQTQRLIVSGVIGPDLDGVLAAYAGAGLHPVDRRGASGWRAVLLERPGG
jgi:ribosomal protein L11 methyltransferase